MSSQVSSSTSLPANRSTMRPKKERRVASQATAKYIQVVQSPRGAWVSLARSIVGRSAGDKTRAILTPAGGMR